MEAIVVNRMLIPQEVKDILDLLKQYPHAVVYSNVDLPAELHPFLKGQIDLSPEEKKEINFDIFSRILQFGEIQINNAAITDLLTYEKVSLWHYHKFRIYFSVRNLYYEIELINKLKPDYDRIIYFGSHPYLKMFPFESPGIDAHINQSNKDKFNKKTAFNYAIFFFIRLMPGLFQTSKLRGKKHVIIDHTIKQTCLNLFTLKPERGNYNLQYLFDRLDEDFIVLSDSEIPKFDSESGFPIDVSAFKSDGKTLFGEWILFRGLISASIRKKLKKVSNHSLDLYRKIESELNDPFHKITFKHLVSLHSSSKLFLFKYLAYQKFFSRHPFKSVSSIDENSPRIKAILDAAKSKNIATIGIQHGTIHELHPAYIYTKEDRKRKIVPDYTMVWGKYWSSFLIEKGNYKPEALYITGQVRTDIIPHLTNIKTKDHLKVPDGKRIVVFASQPQRDPKLREKAAFDVFKSVKDLQNVHLIVKLHPAEKNDQGYYHNIAQKAGCPNYQILLQFDLYFLMSLSDIMITCFSTVGAETVYFRKPLIILDHLKQDIQGYFREGIAFQASSSNELKSFIEKVLSGELQINEEKYTNYIVKYAYKIDGQAADRIIDFIKNL